MLDIFNPITNFLFIAFAPYFCMGKAVEFQNLNKGSQMFHQIIYSDSAENINVERNSIGFCGSFIQNSSSGNETFSSIGLSKRYEILLKGERAKIEFSLFAKSDIGFVYFLDSTFEKYLDYSEIHLKGKRKVNEFIENTYSILLITQLLPSYTNIRETNGTIFRQRVGGFFNPGVIQLGYGFQYKLSENNEWVFSIASIRAETVPQFSTDGQLKNSLGSVWILKYGFSADISTHVKLFQRLLIKNSFHLFINSTDKNSIKIASTGAFILSISKSFTLKYESRFAYDYDLMSCFQYRGELLMCYEIQVSR